jgi:ornithine cyclodeaminase/alanine dehydrogenase-like protein (mu-crystallin family)
MLKSKHSRRKFINSSAMALAGISIIPRHVLGGSGYVAANDKINVGCIGTGKQGRILANFFANNCPDVVPVAACDVDTQKLDLFNQVVGKVQKEKNKREVSLKNYGQYRELLENPEVDAVIIATPITGMPR